MASELLLSSYSWIAEVFHEQAMVLTATTLNGTTVWLATSVLCRAQLPVTSDASYATGRGMMNRRGEGNFFLPDARHLPVAQVHL
jgi:hypothetical protein